MKRSQPRRDWSAARAKVEVEGNVCRICGQGPAEAAHIIGREHDEPKRCEACCDGEGWLQFRGVGDLMRREGVLRICRRCGGSGNLKTLWVNPDHIVPLCKEDHYLHDIHDLDLLPYLTREEEVEATRLVGLENARRRTAPSQYESGEG